MRRINISIDEKLDDRARAFAKENGISKSSLIASSLSSYLSAMEQFPKLKNDLQVQIDELRSMIANMEVK